MGKYKDYYMDKEEIINEVLLNKYEKVDGKYIYILLPKNNLHLWGWTEFRKKAEARLLDYKTEGNIILYQVIEVSNDISNELLEEFELIVLDKR